MKPGESAIGICRNSGVHITPVKKCISVNNLIKLNVNIFYEMTWFCDSMVRMVWLKIKLQMRYQIYVCLFALSAHVALVDWCALALRSWIQNCNPFTTYECVFENVMCMHVMPTLLAIPTSVLWVDFDVNNQLNVKCNLSEHNSDLQHINRLGCFKDVQHATLFRHSIQSWNRISMYSTWLSL